MSDTVIIIPARMAASRLPGKPLADIGGIPMVARVAMQAAAAHVGDVVVACCGQEISDAVSSFGFECILTDPALPSGTDRVHQAFKRLKHSYRYIINLQGDLPIVEPEIIVAVRKLLERTEIATACTEILEKSKVNDPNIVKAVMTEAFRALYFTRATAPSGEGVLYEHIGIYGYHPEVLEKFVNLPETALEKRERLEQLRALEHGIRIDVAVVGSAPVAVDTESDLLKVRQLVPASGA